MCRTHAEISRTQHVIEEAGNRCQAAALGRSATIGANRDLVLDALHRRIWCLAKLTFVAIESARGRGDSGPLIMPGVPVLLARESSIVRAALETLLRLEVNP